MAQARRIVAFRNHLTLEYATVDDAVVWAVANRDVPLLGQECASLLARLEEEGRD